ncbi:peptidase E [Lapillicoccus jejuensis]|uniref:Type 1 glutamine amidotransferase-like domain-containing protein n=1 Tax=Lapillicoccus jejuensis TaxID=402171 RepID=UPI00114F7A87|nr:peptidase E [Lapillicoccus jejuensis]
MTHEPDSPGQVLAFSGLLEREPHEPLGFRLLRHAFSLVPPVRVAGRALRVCYVPTAMGDHPDAVAATRASYGRHAPDVELSVLTLFPQPSHVDVAAHLLAQDVVHVEGGSVVNLVAVWRAHGLPDVLRRCWEGGAVLTGASAGSLCWHLGGPTDSYGDALDPFTDGLGLLPFANGVHDDLAYQPRYDVLRRLVADGTLPTAYATQDGVGLHYVGTRLHEVVTLRPRSSAFRVEPDGAGGWREERLPARVLG